MGGSAVAVGVKGSGVGVSVEDKGVNVGVDVPASGVHVDIADGVNVQTITGVIEGVAVLPGATVAVLPGATVAVDLLPGGSGMNVPVGRTSTGVEVEGRGDATGTLDEVGAGRPSLGIVVGGP